MPQLPIPDDWDNETWRLVTLCVPDSLLWIAHLKGAIYTLSRGRTWDRASGTIKDAQAVAWQIFESIDMTCGDQLTDLNATLTGLAGTLDTRLTAILGAMDGLEPALAALSDLANLSQLAALANLSDLGNLSQLTALANLSDLDNLSQLSNLSELPQQTTHLANLSYLSNLGQMGPILQAIQDIGIKLEPIAETSEPAIEDMDPDLTYVGTDTAKCRQAAVAVGSLYGILREVQTYGSWAVWAGVAEFAALAFLSSLVGSTVLVSAAKAVEYGQAILNILVAGTLDNFADDFATYRSQFLCMIYSASTPQAAYDTIQAAIPDMFPGEDEEFLAQTLFSLEVFKNVWANHWSEASHGWDYGNWYAGDCAECDPPSGPWYFFETRGDGIPANAAINTQAAVDGWVTLYSEEYNGTHYLMLSILEDGLLPPEGEPAGNYPTAVPAAFRNLAGGSINFKSFVFESFGVVDVNGFYNIPYQSYTFYGLSMTSIAGPFTVEFTRNIDNV